MFGSSGRSGPRSESLATVIRSNRMSTRPAYTSGRPAQICDLPPKALDAIWKHLGTDEFPKGAPDAFVKLVEHIEVMSATAFLNGLYDLEANDWVWVDPSDQPSPAAMDARGDGRVVQGMCTLIDTMTKGGRDETTMIKSSFLLTRGVSLRGPGPHMIYSDSGYRRTDWSDGCYADEDEFWYI